MSVSNRYSSPIVRRLLTGTYCGFKVISLATDLHVCHNEADVLLVSLARLSVLIYCTLIIGTRACSRTISGARTGEYWRHVRAVRVNFESFYQQFERCVNTLAKKECSRHRYVYVALSEASMSTRERSDRDTCRDRRAAYKMLKGPIDAMSLAFLTRIFVLDEWYNESHPHSSKLAACWKVWLFIK